MDEREPEHPPQYRFTVLLTRHITSVVVIEDYRLYILHIITRHDMYHTAPFLLLKLNAYEVEVPERHRVLTEFRGSGFAFAQD
jgi:hypothetical protein